LESKIEQDLLTIREVASYLRMGLVTAYNLIKENKLPAFKVGRQWRVKKDDLQKFIEQQKQSEKNVNKKYKEQKKDDAQKLLFPTDSKENKTETVKEEGTLIPNKN